jgi:hypothetical protein
VDVTVHTTWLVIKNSYWNSTQKFTDPSDLPALEQAGEFLYIPLIFLLWLALFYVLAIIYRKYVLFHATFMFAAILTMLGPSLERIIFQIYQYYNIAFNLFADISVFLLIDVLLLSLLYYQWKKGYSVKAVVVSLLLYVTGQIGYYTIPSTRLWHSFLSLIM